MHFTLVEDLDSNIAAGKPEISGPLILLGIPVVDSYFLQSSTARTVLDTCHPMSHAAIVDNDTTDRHPGANGYVRISFRLCQLITNATHSTDRYCDAASITSATRLISFAPGTLIESGNYLIEPVQR